MKYNGDRNPISYWNSQKQFSSPAHLGSVSISLIKHLLSIYWKLRTQLKTPAFHSSWKSVFQKTVTEIFMYAVSAHKCLYLLITSIFSRKWISSFFSGILMGIIFKNQSVTHVQSIELSYSTNT